MKIFSSIYGLYFICISDISKKIVLSSLNLFLVRADEWQMSLIWKPIRRLLSSNRCIFKFFDERSILIGYYGHSHAMTSLLNCNFTDFDGSELRRSTKILIKYIIFAQKNLYNFWIEYSSSGWTKHSQAAQGFYKQVKRLWIWQW